MSRGCRGATASSLEGRLPGFQMQGLLQRSLLLSTPTEIFLPELGHARAIGFSTPLHLGAIPRLQGEKTPPEQPQALQEQGFTLNPSSFMPGEKQLTPEPAKLRFYTPPPAACSCQTQKGSRAGSEIPFPARPTMGLRSQGPAAILYHGGCPGAPAHSYN